MIGKIAQLREKRMEIAPYGENSQSQRESLRRAKKIASAVSPFLRFSVLLECYKHSYRIIETKKLIIENVSNK